MATTSIAYTETRAALARRRRERALLPAAFTSAKKAFEADWSKYLIVEVTSTLCREAGEFAERYRLRAYDSVHLAAFAEIAREAGVRDTRFSSFDDALNRAARSLGRTLARARRVTSALQPTGHDGHRSRSNCRTYLTMNARFTGPRPSRLSVSL